MRTQEEILKRIQERKEHDFLGFEISDYFTYLNYENVKPYLKEGITEKDWNLETKTGVEQIKEYMPFAWEKANNCRGISAGRNIDHMIAWLWIDDHEIYDEVEDMYEHNYQYYGKDILKYICDKIEFDCSELDDGIRSNSEY